MRLFKTSVAAFLILLNLALAPILFAQSLPFPGPGAGGQPPIALISHAGAGGNNSATTGAINTTGANFIVIGVGGQTSPPVITDSKSNTWIPLAENNSSGLMAWLWYCQPCTVGSSHTFTVTASAGANTINVAAFSNVATPAFEQQGADAGAGTTMSLTPYGAGALLITNTSGNNSTPNAINQSFTITDTQTYTPGMNFGGGMAYLIETTPTAKNPSWTYTGAANTTTFAVFRGASPSGVYLSSFNFVRGVNGGTTSAKDTTGANFLVAAITSGNGVTAAISDSKSNTWTALNLNSNGGCCAGAKVRLYYVQNPTVGSGHTFTCSTSSIAATCTFAGFAGMNTSSVFDVQDAGTGTATTNSITPGANGELVVSSYITSASITGLSNGFSMIGFGPFQGGSNYSGGLAYYIQPTAASINTVWTTTGTAPSSIAAFKHQ